MADFYSNTGTNEPLANAGASRHADEVEAARRSRDALIAAIDSAISTVGLQIAALKAEAMDGEAASEVEELEGQLRMLDQQRDRVERAPAGSLGSLKMEVSAGLSATRIAADGAASRGYQQVVQHVVEMKSEAVTAVMVRHDRDASDFRRYEQRSASRIEQLGAEKGIDVASIKENRHRLLAERMAAEARGDRVGVFKADALLGFNNVMGLEKVGASREIIEEADRKANEARERYLKEREIQALSEGRRHGLVDGALREHVDAARVRAADELEKEREELRKSNGLADVSISNFMKASGERRVDWAKLRASRATVQAETRELAPMGNQDAGVLRADEQAAQQGPKEADFFAAAPQVRDAVWDAAKGMKGVTADHSQLGQPEVTSQSLPKDQKAIGANKT